MPPVVDPNIDDAVVDKILESGDVSGIFQNRVSARKVRKVGR